MNKYNKEFWVETFLLHTSSPPNLVLLISYLGDTIIMQQ